MRARGDIGFTLVELLVSMALLTVILLVLTSIINSTQRTWSYTTANVEQFRDAREAFESMTRKISQATLNTYWDYQYTNGTSQPPTSYSRQSYLRFVCGSAATLASGTANPTHAIFFQAPLGYVSNSSYLTLDHLLNTWGYFIKFGDDSQARPSFISSSLIPYRYRFRLMEMMEPSDSLSIYQYTSGVGKYQSNIPNNTLYLSSAPPTGYTGLEWLTAPLNNAYTIPNWPASLPSPTVRPIGENIVALVLLPMLSQYDQAASAGSYTASSLAPNYSYDTTNTSVSDPNLDPRNQVPPVIQVTMVAVDEASYKRFQGSSSSMPSTLTSSSLFQTVGDTQNPSNPGYAQDLKTLQNNLQANHLNYRIFSSNVSIEAAKWSRAQQN